MSTLRLFCRAAFGREQALTEEISHVCGLMRPSRLRVNVRCPTVISVAFDPLDEEEIPSTLQRLSSAQSCIEIGLIAASLPLHILDVDTSKIQQIDWTTPFERWKRVAPWPKEDFAFAVQSLKLGYARQHNNHVNRNDICRLLGASFQESQRVSVRCKDPELRIRAVIGEEILVGLLLPNVIPLKIANNTHKEAPKILIRKNPRKDVHAMIKVEKVPELELELELEGIKEYQERNGVGPSCIVRSPFPRLVDVRSPKEFARGHIPGSLNIPVLDDDERHLVGQCYVERGREEAIRLGKRLVGPKQQQLFDAFAALRSESSDFSDETILYCARGGLRSGSLSWWLSQKGMHVQLLSGGYKEFRRWSRENYAALRKRRRVCVIGGKTGAGKTRVLQTLARMESQVFDLETLAVHAGSAFGAVPFYSKAQPTNEQFANDLAMLWGCLEDDAWLFVEDEGSHIGSVLLPPEFYKGVLRSADLILRLDLSKEARARNLVEDYASGHVRQNHNDWVEKMKQSVHRLANRLGNERSLQALKLLEAERFVSFAELLLTYYDNLYEKHISLDSRSCPHPSRLDSAIVGVHVDGLSETEAASRVLDAVDRFDMFEQVAVK